jgi:hypothetical protein
MRNDQIITGLKELAVSCDVAIKRCRRRDTVRQIRDQQVLVLAAADAIVQLQARLVRQACYFEHIEAVNEPRWPLLEDNDDPGMGL